MWLACGYKSYNYKIWDQIWLNFKLYLHYYTKEKICKIINDSPKPKLKLQKIPRNLKLVPR